MTTVEETVATFSRWLFMPDPRALYAVLGTVAANRLPGDPVWLAVVAPPGSGKTELLQSLLGLPNVHATATLTEAALLSGTPKRERATSAKGGLLREIGEFGIIVCKDFGSVLAMHRDARAQTLAAFREVYDGSWTRHVGTDGGQTLHWTGKVGMVAGCTPTIDRHHGVMASMGERLLLFRIPEAESAEHARRALDHAGHERAMRRELAEAVTRLFAGGLSKPRALNEAEREGLVALTTLVTKCRSSVERDGYSREVELIPDAEAPTRLVVTLDRLLAGLDALGLERSIAWSVVRQAALDSIPALRRSVMEALHASASETETAKVAEAVGYPTQTTRRALEDLAAHRVVLRESRGKGRSDVWTLAEWARALSDAAASVPETSEHVLSLSVPDLSDDGDDAFDDFSGKVGRHA